MSDERQWVLSGNAYVYTADDRREDELRSAMQDRTDIECFLLKRLDELRVKLAEHTRD